MYGQSLSQTLPTDTTSFKDPGNMAHIKDPTIDAYAEEFMSFICMVRALSSYPIDRPYEIAEPIADISNTLWDAPSITNLVQLTLDCMSEHRTVYNYNGSIGLYLRLRLRDSAGVYAQPEEFTRFRAQVF